MRVLCVVMAVAALVLAAYAFFVAGQIGDVRAETEAYETRYMECSEAVNELQIASDYLTTQVRMFVVTGDKKRLDNYLDELYVSNNRNKAVEKLKNSFSQDQAASAELEAALADSNDLARDELHAMRLAVDAYGIKKVSDKITSEQLKADEQDMSANQKLEEARSLVLGKSYDKTKNTIQKSVKASSEALLTETNADFQRGTDALNNLLLHLRIVIALLFCIIVLLVVVVTRQALRR